MSTGRGEQHKTKTACEYIANLGFMLFAIYCYHWVQEEDIET